MQRDNLPGRGRKWRLRKRAAEYGRRAASPILIFLSIVPLVHVEALMFSSRRFPHLSMSFFDKFSGKKSPQTSPRSYAAPPSSSTPTPQPQEEPAVSVLTLSSQGNPCHWNGDGDGVVYRACFFEKADPDVWSSRIKGNGFRLRHGQPAAQGSAQLSRQACQTGSRSRRLRK